MSRLAKPICKRDLSKMRKALKPYGQKAEVYRQTGVSVGTIGNILKTGSGLTENVDKLVNYCNTKFAAA